MVGQTSASPVSTAAPHEANGDRDLNAPAITTITTARPAFDALADQKEKHGGLDALQEQAFRAYLGQILTDVRKGSPDPAFRTGSLEKMIPPPAFKDVQQNLQTVLRLNEKPAVINLEFDLKRDDKTGPISLELLAPGGREIAQYNGQIADGNRVSSTTMLVLAANEGSALAQRNKIHDHISPVLTEQQETITELMTGRLGSGTPETIYLRRGLAEKFHVEAGGVSLERTTELLPNDFRTPSLAVSITNAGQKTEFKLDPHGKISADDDTIAALNKMMASDKSAR